MKNIRVIAGKELRGYLNSPMAYIVICVFLLITGTFFSTYLKKINYTDTTIYGFLQYATYLLLIFAAFITMRSLSEEKKLGTWELLLTSPVRDSDVVIGKFMAGVGLMTLMLILTMYYPLLLVMFHGDPDMGPIWASYLGLFLLGSSAIAIGIFVSSLTSNQIISGVVCAGILFGLWFLGTVASASYMPKAIGQVLNYFSLQYHFTDFSIGIIDTRSIVYYLSIIALFLYSAVRSLETGRWN
jgi:ABC-2 type transport system permease protein